jgi:RimJ/RimL family protein N-acetyltransferase
MKFKPLSLENLAEALAIQRRLFPGEDGEWNFMTAIGAAPKSEWEDEFMYWILRDEENSDVGIIGLYSYTEYGDDAWVGWFGITPEHRGKGYAREALGELERTAAKKGYKNLRLYTDAVANKDACGLYEHLGFKAESYREKDEKYGDGMLIYSKRLGRGKAPPWNNRHLHLDEQREKEILGWPARTGSADPPPSS